jgi:AraC-like DNA-binding protein
MFDAKQSPSPLPDDHLVDSADAARLWLPRMSLSNCTRGVMVRNTTGTAPDTPRPLNHFPASPTCTITWFFEGSAEEVAPGAQGIGTGQRTPMPGRLVFSGPFNRPLAGQYTGPVHLMLLAMLPDAFEALTGIDLGGYVNRFVAAESVLDARWLALCQDVFDAPNDEARVALIDERLSMWWKVKRSNESPGVHLLDDWYQGLALRAANTGLGRSARQIERRIKQWTGQPLRELRGMSRSEQAFFAAASSIEQGEVNWAHVANEVGYADQSHLCRQTRRITGFAPDELARRIAQDEGFWAYRLWGFSEARPGRK